ncbi:hypothetical protein GCM10010206_40500 [Streptomyces cinerochromogenes]|nr:hypothetical protein GCM10010206_40500 [Streptomyces cinerochromogenes]
MRHKLRVGVGGEGEGGRWARVGVEGEGGGRVGMQSRERGRVGRDGVEGRGTGGPGWVPRVGRWVGRMGAGLFDGWICVRISERLLDTGRLMLAHDLVAGG